MADFQEHHEALKDAGIGVVALSVDGREDAEGIVERLGLSYPVLYGVDHRDVRDRYGVYVDEENGYLHAAAFLLRHGEVFHANYSSGPLARLRAENVMGWVAHTEKQERGDG